MKTGLQRAVFLMPMVSRDWIRGTLRTNTGLGKTGDPGEPDRSGSMWVGIGAQFQWVQERICMGGTRAGVKRCSGWYALPVKGQRNGAVARGLGVKEAPAF